MVVVDRSEKTKRRRNLQSSVVAEADGGVTRGIVADIHEVCPVVLHGREVGFIEKHHRREFGRSEPSFSIESLESIAPAVINALKSLGERIPISHEVAFGGPAALHGDRQIAVGKFRRRPKRERFGRLTAERLRYEVESKDVRKDGADRCFARSRRPGEDGQEVLREGQEEVEDVVGTVAANG